MSELRVVYRGMDGREIGSEEASALFASKDARRVASDDIDGYSISTVLLVIDHEFMPGKPPLIFETMIFTQREDSTLNEWQERYSTREEAERGHRIATHIVRAEIASFEEQP